MAQGGAAARGAAKVQDQGWAWMVLVAAVVLQGLTLGFPSCIGVFFTDLQHEFQATNSETSWFPSIMVAVLHAGGLLVDITSDFRYVFYTSSFFLISASLFMVLSFCALQKNLYPIGQLHSLLRVKSWLEAFSNLNDSKVL